MLDYVRSKAYQKKKRYTLAIQIACKRNAKIKMKAKYRKLTAFLLLEGVCQTIQTMLFRLKDKRKEILVEPINI